MTEVWIVEKGVRKGKPFAKRHKLRVPLDVATGNYERLSDLQVREVLKDFHAEQARRGPSAAAPRSYDPMQSQIRGDDQ